MAEVGWGGFVVVFPAVGFGDHPLRRSTAFHLHLPGALRDPIIAVLAVLVLDAGEVVGGAVGELGGRLAAERVELDNP